MLQSQVGVDKVENAYGNLKKGLIHLKAHGDKAIDLGRLVDVLEKEVGFEPVTEVTLELRGQLERRGKKLVFETSGTGQTFTVAGIKAPGGSPPEKDVVTVTAILEKPRSLDRIVVRGWNPGEQTGQTPH